MCLENIIYKYPEIDIEEAMNYIIYGQTILKLGNRGDPHYRRFYLNESDPCILQWITPAKTAEKSQLRLKDIYKITFGISTKQFMKFKKKFTPWEDVCLSLHYKKGLRKVDSNLNLKFYDQKQFKMWLTGIQYFIVKAQSPFAFSLVDGGFIEHRWKIADVNCNNLLKLGELKNMLWKLNVPISERYIEQQFRHYFSLGVGNIDKLEALDISYFKELLKNATEKDALIPIFNKYKSPDTQLISHLKLQEFFKKEQKENITMNEVNNLIGSYGSYLYCDYLSIELLILQNKNTEYMNEFTDEAEDPIREPIDVSDPQTFFERREKSLKTALQSVNSMDKPKGLNLAGFTRMISSFNNALCDPKYELVHQDMDLPFPNYYIHSSFKTFMKFGEEGEPAISSVLYKKALLMGCRYLEIDLIVLYIYIYIYRHQLTIRKHE